MSWLNQVDGIVSPVPVESNLPASRTSVSLMYTLIRPSVVW